LLEIGQFQDGLRRVFALVFRHPASVALKMLEFYGMLARLWGIIPASDVSILEISAKRPGMGISGEKVLVKRIRENGR
jgi:hypothetical protein